MAQLVIAAAGAAIGGAIAPGVVALGMTGASIGWAVGSMVGAAFGPSQRVKGPRLDDLRVTGAEYGQTIPFVAGHPRVAGQIWWASDRREISTTTEVGGKGGGGGVEQTTYTYEVDVLIGLCDNTIGYVARVWSNGKLVSTALSDADTGSLESSVTEAPWERMTVYTGAADQLPDPTYEAAVGAGNAPAYRGRGSVFIEKLQLGSSGVLPNLTFEISQTQAPPDESVLLSGDFSTGVLTDLSCDSLGEPTEQLGPLSESFGADGVTFTQDASASGFSSKGFGWIDNRFVASGQTRTYELLCSVGNSTFVVGASEVGPTVFTIGENLSPNNYVVTLLVDPFLGSCRIYRAFVGDSGYVGSAPRGSKVHFAIHHPASPSAEDPVRYYINGQQVWTNSSGFGGTNDAIFCGGQCGIAPANTIHQVTYYGVRLTLGALYPDGDSFTPPDSLDAPLCITTTERQPPTLQSVVDAICTRAGMPAGTWDATALAAITTPVRAFTIGQVGSTRAALEQLMAAYFFEAYATDKLYFIPRAAASAMTIDADDLGTGLEEPADELLPMTIGNEMEVPAQISLSYSNADADYNIATEHSDRMLSGQPSTSAVQLPLGMTASEAKTVADAMLVDGLASRTTGSMTLPMAYAELVPTDVVTVPDDDGNTYRVRIVRRGDEGPLIRLDWVLDDATAVESAGITSDDYTPELDVPLRPDTLIEPMDIPILRDADDGPGVYVAAKGETTPWPGALVMASTDDVSFNTVADVAEAAVFGSCTSVLDDWSGGWVFDMDGSVEVDVGDGTLSSTTRDALLADRTVNAMLVGDEVIRFMTAAAGAPGVYTLSGLLRGQLGTEASCTGHGASERCVLLRPQGLRRVPTSLAARGQTYYVRGITRGQSLASVASETFTDLGVGMMPYAPVDVRGVRTTEHIVVTWKRRSRYVTSVTGILSAPLGEATEAYPVTILSSGGAALREVDTDEPVLYYDVDDVESDYGSLPPMIMLSIAQLGAGGIVGRTTTVALEVNTGVEVPGGGVTPDDGEQTPTLDLQIWHAGGSNVLVYRPVEGVAASLYVSSGTTLTAQAWPATPRPISRGVYYSDQLSIVVGASYYRLGFYTPFVPGTSSPNTLVGHVVPSAIGSAPVAVGDPLDYMIGGTTPPRCLGYDGTTVYGISMDRQDGALWSADSWPDPTGWTSVGALTQTGTESSPPWPWWQEGLNRLLKTTAGWIYVHSDGVWRTTQAVPQTGWDRIEAVSNDTGGWPHSPWWHLDALVDGARVYLCGPEYCAVSTDSGATWTVTSLPAPVPTNPYTIPDTTFARLGKLGANVVAMTDGGTRVAINDGSGSGWTEHATSGIETYPTQYAGNRGRVDHAVSDGTRLWVVEREIVSQVAITPADPVTYSRFRVRVSTDGVNYSSPEFA